MKDINLGQNVNNEEVSINFKKDNIHFITLLGSTGSGKSVFHEYLYNELMDAYSPDELGFIFMDMTMVDFMDWDDRYLIAPVVTNSKNGLDVFDKISKGVFNIPKEKIIFIHIEECNMVYEDRKRFEKALDIILSDKENNIYIVYSTSKIDKEYLNEWLEKYVDLNIVFKLDSTESSEFLLGDDTAYKFTEAGSRVIVVNDKKILCKSFDVLL